MRRVRRQAGGFTLLEVMVAMVLLAAALMATADLAGAALRNHEMARDLNVAVLLARARMAELEERYEDQGFKDQDESEQGDFATEGAPEFRWKLEVLRPAPNLTADQVVGMLTGATGSGSAEELMSKLMGGAAGGAAGASSAGSGTASVAGGGQALALLSTALQAQVTGFAEKVKRSLREMRLTVSWAQGKRQRSITIVTHLVVLNPRAPGGARGDSPDVPAGLVAQTQAAAAATAAAAAAAAGATPGRPPGRPPGFGPGLIPPRSRETK